MYFFSSARGGGPCNPQSRAGAESVIEWCRDCTIDRVIVENVKEFLNYGPLDGNNEVIPSLRGTFFKAWCDSLRSLGYRVDWRVLCAADYTAPTSRERLFVQAVRIDSGKRIIWPEPWVSHANRTPAADIIDWSDTGTPLHMRAKPLCERTLARIEKGIQKYWGEWAQPYLVILRGKSITRDVYSPLPTVTSGGGHFGLVCPIDNGSQRV